MPEFPLSTRGTWSRSQVLTKIVDRELETIQAVLRARGVEQPRYSINRMKFVASETARGLGLIAMLFLSPSQDVIF